MHVKKKDHCASLWSFFLRSFFLRDNLYILDMLNLFLTPLLRPFLLPLMLPVMLCALFLAACSDNDPIDMERSGAPALWKVTKNSDKGADGNQSANASILYIFGTIHLLPKGAHWQNETLDKAIAESDHLILETTGLDDSANVSRIFTSMSTDEDVIKITQRLDGGNLQKLKNLIDDQNLSASGLSKMETWAAALAISNSLTSDMGLQRSLGVETILTQRFKGKPIEGLETIASQFSIFDDLAERDQRAMLQSIVTDSDNSDAAFLTLLHAWLDGDIDQINAETQHGILSSPNVREALLDGRNRKWVRALYNRLNDEGTKTYFVAVGAAHLVGPNGVPELLKSAGYRVQRIQ